MISHEYKCIFIHIPKCAGTSIEKALGHHSEWTGRGRQDHRTLRMYQPGIPVGALLGKENTVQFLKKNKYLLRAHKSPNPKNKLTLTRKQYMEYFKFTVVRNPYERVFSWYWNVMSDKKHMKNLNHSSNTTFEEFLKEYAGKRHLLPQTDFIREYNGKINMDYIIRFENLSKEFKYVADKLNLPNFHLPHEVKSKSDKADYREYYNKITKNIVDKIYKEEIVLFGYAF